MADVRNGFIVEFGPHDNGEGSRQWEAERLKTGRVSYRFKPSRAKLEAHGLGDGLWMARLDDAIGWQNWRTHKTAGPFIYVLLPHLENWGAVESELGACLEPFWNKSWTEILYHLAFQPRPKKPRARAA